MSEPVDTPQLAAALEYSAVGICIIPILRNGTKRPIGVSAP